MRTSAGASCPSTARPPLPLPRSRRIDDCGAEPLNLIDEIKGFRNTDALLKAETMRALWVPGVNNLGIFGRWGFAEFAAVFEIEAAFATLIDEATRH